MHCRAGGMKCLTYERPAEQATEPQVKQDASWTVLCHTCVASPVDLMFKQSENIAMDPLHLP